METSNNPVRKLIDKLRASIRRRYQVRSIHFKSLKAGGAGLPWLADLLDMVGPQLTKIQISILYTRSPELHSIRYFCHRLGQTQMFQNLETLYIINFTPSALSIALQLLSVAPNLKQLSLKLGELNNKRLSDNIPIMTELTSVTIAFNWEDAENITKIISSCPKLDILTLTPVGFPITHSTVNQVLDRFAGPPSVSRLTLSLQRGYDDISYSSPQLGARFEAFNHLIGHRQAFLPTNLLKLCHAKLVSVLLAELAVPSEHRESGGRSQDHFRSPAVSALCCMDLPQNYTTGRSHGSSSRGACLSFDGQFGFYPLLRTLQALQVCNRV